MLHRYSSIRNVNLKTRADNTLVDTCGSDLLKIVPFDDDANLRLATHLIDCMHPSTPLARDMRQGMQQRVTYTISLVMGMAKLRGRNH